MSEEYEISIGPLQGMIARAEEGLIAHWTELHEWIWKAALVERLERLVQVLEQIRDKPPASYTV